MSNAKSAPDAEVLRKYLLGELPPDQLEMVEAYVMGSESDLSVLDTLKAQDTLVESIRAGISVVRDLDRQHIDSQMERLKGLRSGSQARDLTASLEQDADSHTAQITPDDCTFLSAAEADDEIGRLGDYRILKILGHGHRLPGGGHSAAAHGCS